MSSYWHPKQGWTGAPSSDDYERELRRLADALEKERQKPKTFWQWLTTSTPEIAPPRCESVHAGERCDDEIGHAGPHGVWTAAAVGRRRFWWKDSDK